MRRLVLVSAVGLAVIASAWLLLRRDSARIEIVKGALWRTGGSGEPVKVAGPGEFLESRDEDRLAFFSFPTSSDEPSLGVWPCLEDGRVVDSFQFSGEDLRGITCLTDAGWLDRGRLFAVGHVNPSLSCFLTISLEKGRLERHEGVAFCWMPRRAVLAYVKDPPHYCPPERAVSEIWIGRQRVGEARFRARWTVAWAPGESKLAVVAELPSEVKVFAATPDDDGVTWQGRWLPSRNAEGTGSFGIDGKPIHPGCIWELGASIADPLPRIAAIDVKGIERSNKYANSTITRVQDWTELRDADLLGTNAFFRYKPLGALSNGTWALRTEECTGGTGVFMNVLLVRLERDRVYDHDRCRWRIVLKAVGSIGLGDRDDGTVELKGNAIILGKSKYRDEPKSITVSLE